MANQPDYQVIGTAHIVGYDDDDTEYDITVVARDMPAALALLLKFAGTDYGAQVQSVNLVAAEIYAQKSD
jgi:hypothetical protein